MKKSLIAMAVAGVVAAPMAAEAGGYGRLAIGLAVPNEDRADGNVDPYDTSNVDPADSDIIGTVQHADGDGTFGPGNGGDDMFIEDTSSYVGFRGEEDLGNGLTAFFNYQFDVDGGDGTLLTDSARQSHVGLRGDFGAVKVGKSTDPYYGHVGVLTDWGWSISAPAFYGLNAVPGIDISNLYRGHSVNYGNSAGAFSFDAMIQTENQDGLNAGQGSSNQTESFDQIYLGGTFEVGAGTVAVAHHSVQTPGSGAEPSSLSFGGTYSLGDIGFRGAYYTVDRDISGQASDPAGFDLMVTSDFGGGLSGYLAYSQIDFDFNSDRGNTSSVWGQVSQSLSDRTSLYAEFLSESVDGGNTSGDIDPSEVNLGVVHYF